jgi:DNA topoisomerase-1
VDVETARRRHQSPDPCLASAAAAGLHYVSPEAPGIARERRGRGFVYRAPNGRVITEPRTLNRIRALVLPPAWTDVWIATDALAHLQATGRDAAGRKQYRYHALWTAERDSTKYHRMRAFANALPLIRRRTARDLRSAAASRARVLATVVTLLERTCIRVGNEEYVKSNRSHGLTTLRDRHVTIRGRRMRFAFRAKSGVRQTIELEDASLARAVRECQDLPGQTLFQYLDEGGAVRSVTSSDVNAYLRDICGAGFTAKDFRTWAGTLAAARELDGCPPPVSATAGNRTIVEAIDRVADTLGNTRAVCRKCYIHPVVLDAFRSGVTIGRVTVTTRSAPKGLDEAERKLVALLSQMEQKRADKRIARKAA